MNASDAPTEPDHRDGAEPDVGPADRARLRQASRLFERRGGVLSKEDLVTIEAADIRASRVFAAARTAS